MRFVHLGLDPDFVDYEQAWQVQRDTHAKVVAGEEPDTVYLLQHRAVYTAGKPTEPQERPNDGTPVIDVDRGGKITWHGPGQITGYPIVRLPAPIDVVGYVRHIEEMMMRVCADLGGEGCGAAHGGDDAPRLRRLRRRGGPRRGRERHGDPRRRPRPPPQDRRH